MDVLETLDNLQNAAEQDSEKNKSNNKKSEYHFDKLRMYFGEDYTINNITISVPTIGDILEVGETRFYQSLSPFLNNPTSIRVFLYDTFHKDWNKTKDIEVFYIMYQLVQDKEPLNLIFKDFNFDGFVLTPAKKNKQDTEYDHLALFNEDKNILMLQSLKAFMKYYSPDIEEDVLALFSGVVQDTYARFGITFTSDFSKFTSKDYPTFSDVYITVTSKLTSMTEKTHERDVMERLELKLRPLVRELKYYFNGHTSINTESDFLVFNIKELMNSDANIRNALLFNVLKFAWGLCLNPNVNTVLSVDEAHVLLGAKNELGAEFLAQVQRRARKYNTGTIIITQQPSDFVADGILMHGKAIFDNSSYYLVMGLKKQAVEDLAMLIDLNDNEKESIKRFSQGEALFVCGNRRMQINVIVTEDELESFGSGGGL